MEPLVTPQFSGTCLPSQNFGEKLGRFRLRNCQLLRQISRVLFGFCSAYIYSFERFFSQLFNGIHDYFVTFTIFEIEEKMQKNLWKYTEFITLMDPQKFLRGSPYLGYGHIIREGPLFPTIKNRVTPGHPHRTKFSIL